MGRSTEQRKAAQLGMPCGTATNRLRKQIMLHLLTRLGEDLCHKCGKRIESAIHLTIEHKIPWLDADPSLFWDLDNIAFSHSWCNRPNRPRGGCGAPRENIHGKQMMYKRGCRCDQCRDWKRIDRQRWLKRP